VGRVLLDEIPMTKMDGVLRQCLSFYQYVLPRAKVLGHSTWVAYLLDAACGLGYDWASAEAELNMLSQWQD